MKRQKTKNRGDFYGEKIFNIAAYNCSRNFTISGKNSKRATSQMVPITNYLHNMPKTPKE